MPFLLLLIIGGAAAVALAAKSSGSSSSTDLKIGIIKSKTTLYKDSIDNANAQYTKAIATRSPDWDQIQKDWQAKKEADEKASDAYVQSRIKLGQDTTTAIAVYAGLAAVAPWLVMGAALLYLGYLGQKFLLRFLPGQNGNSNDWIQRCKDAAAFYAGKGIPFMAYNPAMVSAMGYAQSVFDNLDKAVSGPQFNDAQSMYEAFATTKKFFGQDPLVQQMYDDAFLGGWIFTDKPGVNDNPFGQCTVADDPSFCDPLNRGANSLKTSMPSAIGCAVARQGGVPFVRFKEVIAEAQNGWNDGIDEAAKMGSYYNGPTAVIRAYDRAKAATIRITGTKFVQVYA